MSKEKEAEIEHILKALSMHLNEPVLPMSRYCGAMNKWADCITEAYEEDGGDESLEKFKRKESDKFPRFSDVVPYLGSLRLAITKSSLLARLLYRGETFRTKKCPQHQGYWSLQTLIVNTDVV